MRIVRVAWTTFRVPFVQRFATSHGAQAMRAGILLRLETDDGCVGLGEASPFPGLSAESLDEALRAVERCAPGLLGRDPLADEPTLPPEASAACALDVALHDLRAQAAGRPVAALLAEHVRGSVAVNAVVAVDGPAAAAARAMAAQGFGCVKLKVGMAASTRQEVERIAAVREAIGPDVALRLDANGAWDADTAIAVIRAAEPAGLELVEQPVARDDLAGLARVRQATGVRIAADESACTVADAWRVVAAAAADVLVVKPMLAGGLAAGRKIVELASDHGLEAIVTTSVDAGVGLAAALHLAATLPTPARACGLATGPLLESDLLARPLLVERGAMRVPSDPGLGICLDQAQVERFADGWREVSAC